MAVGYRSIFNLKIDTVVYYRYKNVQKIVKGSP
jgi:hypothetical protein